MFPKVSFQDAAAHAVALSVALACSGPVAQGITVPPWVVTASRSALSLTDLLADALAGLRFRY